MVSVCVNTMLAHFNRTVFICFIQFVQLELNFHIIVFAVDSSFFNLAAQCAFIVSLESDQSAVTNSLGSYWPPVYLCKTQESRCVSFPMVQVNLLADLLILYSVPLMLSVKQGSGSYRADPTRNQGSLLLQRRTLYPLSHLSS